MALDRPFSLQFRYGLTHHGADTLTRPCFFAHRYKIPRCCVHSTSSPGSKVSSPNQANAEVAIVHIRVTFVSYTINIITKSAPNGRIGEPFRQSTAKTMPHEIPSSLFSKRGVCRCQHIQSKSRKKITNTHKTSVSRLKTTKLPCATQYGWSNLVVCQVEGVQPEIPWSVTVGSTR